MDRGRNRLQRRSGGLEITRGGNNKHPRHRSIRYIPESSRNADDKPVVRLFDPTSVPRAGRYYEVTFF